MSDVSLSRDQATPRKPMRWLHWVLAVIASGAILGFGYFLMWKTGLLLPATTDANEKTLAAALVLIGTVFTAAVTLVGILLKFSSDERSASLAEEEGFRNRIDVSLRAVALMGENNQDASQTQISGALLALVNLGELDLSISLLGELWPKDQATLYVASQVLQAAFRSASPGAKLDAACVIQQNANHIAAEGISVWPFENMKWPITLEKTTRLTLARAAADWVRWAVLNDPTMPSSVIVILYGALTDEDKEVTEVAAGALCPIFDAYPDASYVPPSGPPITASMIRERCCDSCPQDKPMTDRFENAKLAVIAALRERGVVDAYWQPSDRCPSDEQAKASPA